MRRLLTNILNFILCRHSDWRYYPTSQRMRRYHDAKWESREPTQDELLEPIDWQANR